MPKRHNRKKLSTTIAPENAAFLNSLLKRGQAATVAEAVDKVISAARRSEARKRLEAATEAYFASLSAEARNEESRLAEALTYEADHVNFDE